MSTMNTDLNFAEMLYNGFIERGDFSGIKDALKLAGMNQSELARRIGVERATVSAWASGARLPSLRVFSKVVFVLDNAANKGWQHFY